jgi:dipeptidyl aminopeptidase/acylaminoacyl peptidase
VSGTARLRLLAIGVSLLACGCSRLGIDTGPSSAPPPPVSLARERSVAPTTPATPSVAPILPPRRSAASSASVESSAPPIAAGWASPAWSPDATALAVVRTTAKTGQLVRVAVDDGTPSYLTTSPAVRSLGTGRVWNDSGILYSSDESGLHQVWLMDPATRRARLMGWDGADNSDASWSPTGNAIVLARRVYGELHWGLWVVSGDRLLHLTFSMEPTGDVSSPSWSGNGRSILFSYGLEGARNLYVADISNPASLPPSGESQVIVKPFIVGPGDKSGASWIDAQGDALFSITPAAGAPPDLYAFWSGTVVRLFSGADGGGSFGAAAPDASRVAFVRGPAGSERVVVADLVARPQAR